MLALGSGPGRSWRRYSSWDYRGLLTVLCGTTIYLMLFSVFGLSSNRTARLNSQQFFPRKIWQLWKVDALSFESRETTRARSWLQKNPTLQYEVLTDASGLSYVERAFGPLGFNRPDVVEIYSSLNATIIQADLLRYIVMYNEGGIYADVDVTALKSFDHFIPSRFQEQDIDLIIGVETDEPDFRNHPRLGVKSQSFCQWVFVCKPRQKAMLRLIDHIVAWIRALAKEQGTSIGNLELSFDAVLNGTGPSAFTNAILEEMSSASRRSYTWDDFHGMTESKVVARTLVLPSEAFAAGTGHSNSGNHNGQGALVAHHFHASKWPKNHPRYSHPVFGPVESCNWNTECVKLWDTNTAWFETLPLDEQLKMIALKSEEEAQAFRLLDQAGQGGHIQNEQAQFGNQQIQANQPQQQQQQQPPPVPDDIQQPGNQQIPNQPPQGGSQQIQVTNGKGNNGLQRPGNQQAEDDKLAVSNALLGSGEGSQSPKGRPKPDDRTGLGNGKGDKSELEAYFLNDDS